LETFVAVDVETTGLDFETERLIELAAVRFENGSVVAEFQALLPPGKTLTAIARLLTGLNETELNAAPPVADTLKAFLAFAGTLPLVAHNAGFDGTFLRLALEREELPPLPGPWLDSLLLARAAWPEWENHRLDFLAGRLSIPRDAEHRALPDARRAGEVFIAAQRSLRDSASPATWQMFAKLEATSAGWKLVFSGE